MKQTLLGFLLFRRRAAYSFYPSDHSERGHPTKVIEILLPLKRRQNDE